MGNVYKIETFFEYGAHAVKTVSIVRLVQNDIHRHTSTRVKQNVLQFSFYHGTEERKKNRKLFIISYISPPKCTAYAASVRFCHTKCDVLGRLFTKCLVSLYAPVDCQILKHLNFVTLVVFCPRISTHLRIEIDV